MISHNLKAFERDKAVDMFNVHTLQTPEHVIFDLLPLNTMSVLDLGVGTGRTTPFLAPHSKSYIGTDYSEPMIVECKKQFPDEEFRVCDARNMSFDKKFDFIFFSFNGIDNMPHEDRITTLKEIKAFLNPRGSFAFSTHNIYGARKLFHIQLNRKPKRMFESIKRWYKTTTVNPPWSVVRAKDHIVINEGAHALALQQYHIKPEAQIAQLQSIGFTNIRVFDLQGQQLQDPFYTEDSWVYYLCSN
ncbi:MAG: class I SAM-dependent methyltransferase, partial [Candidatus Peribacteraceae bacterium]|jgi:ubiquinone/menaquinone biosynthesis C-methylase UbiE|nr:class I SAM-dependent methyltransferase [Candidatus Peribacteraceae bacterium]